MSLRALNGAEKNRCLAAHGSPFQHVVQFYEDDAFLMESVARYLHPALASGGTAVVVATSSHLATLVAEMGARGFDLDKLTAARRYFALDAVELLDRFMIEGWPDEARFHKTVGNLLANARPAPGQPLAAFGEMVALLCMQGKHDAALRLERLWNQLSRRHSFSLFCAYPMAAFEKAEDTRPFFHICGEHSDVCPTEEYPALGSEGQRRRAVAVLQQKTRALENEIRLHRERLVFLQNSARAGTWEMDLEEEIVSLSSRAAALLHLRSHRMALPEFLHVMHYSGDRDAFLAALKMAATRRKEFISEFRVLDKEEARVLCIRGRVFYNNGAPLMLGVLSDVTPAQAA